ncbi:hypothetical protein SAMN06295981_1204 [Corynebacterium pollutisoli]|uniref:Uncharacterized protein n=1 Tax=Corynebacterium pollutisoli TaxID=1610489 RepID=A0A1X7J359_9CORY|nr:PorA family porin [Corynebacterium pollutisoli]SMG21830.1 hypothetical protein SAMN06295981_1204 [Corynebacterium pollutisoli]
MSSNLIEFFGTVGQLSSGYVTTEESVDDEGNVTVDEVTNETIFSYLFDLLGTAGDWAGAVANLIGLVP